MLQIKNLKVKRDEDIVIKNAELSLGVGEIVKISGANGSGKSSLMSSIFNVHGAEIEEGDVLVNGKSIRGIEGDEIARQGIYYAVQHPPVVKGIKTVQFLYKAYKNFHPLSTDNILVWRERLEKRCLEYKLNISLINDELNTNLSGGEKKLAQLIHALAIDANYLLLDECDSGVDAENRNLVYNFINKQKEEGKGIIFTSHIDAGKQVSVDREYILENKFLTKNK